MIVDRHSPRSAAELIKSIANALDGSRVAVVQAGHFLLFLDTNTNRALPCVASEMSEERFGPFREEAGHFPQLSWSLALKVLSAVPTEKRYLLVLVNDWQYVKNLDARSGFYEEHVVLPKSYILADEVAKQANVALLTPSGVTTFSGERPYFRETTLRNQFNRRLEKLSSSNSIPEGMAVAQDADGATCVVDVMGAKREIYCSSKSADCAGEVAQLIDQAHALVSCDTFINFAPAVCKQFVELGSELGPRVFGPKVRRVINVFLPATQVYEESDFFDEAELSIHEF